MMKKYIRALRLPFIIATVFPFIFGSLIERKNFDWWIFLLGLLCAVSTHLSANLINDYADSKSGVDWKDKTFFGFFGGSKLIQEGELSEKFYLTHSLLMAGIALICVTVLTISLKTFAVIGYFLLIGLLGFFYSHRPLQFSYRCLGEVVIFILFGPALVMGGYYLQTGIFPDFRSFMLSVPLGLFTTNILVANEVPDYREDVNCGKHNLINMLPAPKAFYVYYFILCISLAYVCMNIYWGYLRWSAFLVFPAAGLSVKAGIILKRHYSDKKRLVESSALTINFQILANLILILALFL